MGQIAMGAGGAGPRVVRAAVIGVILLGGALILRSAPSREHAARHRQPPAPAVHPPSGEAIAASLDRSSEPPPPPPPPPLQVVRKGTVYEPTPEDSVTWEQKLAAIQAKDPVVAKIPMLAGHGPDQQLAFLRWSLRLPGYKIVFSIPELARATDVSLDERKKKAVEIYQGLVDRLESQGARAPALPADFTPVRTVDETSASYVGPKPPFDPQRTTP